MLKELFILKELKNLLPGPPMFFPMWKVNWGIRNIPTPTKSKHPNSWRPKSWCYIIQTNPNAYVSLIPFMHSAETWGELGWEDLRACVLHQARHVFSVVVAIALITHTRQIFSTSFYFHFLGGARAAHQPATAPAVMAPVKLSKRGHGWATKRIYWSPLLYLSTLTSKLTPFEERKHHVG